MIYKQGHVTDGLDHPFMVKSGANDRTLWSRKRVQNVAKANIGRWSSPTPRTAWGRKWPSISQNVGSLLRRHQRVGGFKHVKREREKKEKTLSSGIIAWQHVQNTNNPLSHRPSHTFRPIFWGQNMEFPEGNPCEFTLKPGEQLETPVVMKQNGRQSLRQSSRVGRVGLALKKLRWQVVF